jgi:hypothetical protein
LAVTCDLTPISMQSIRILVVPTYPHLGLIGLVPLGSDRESLRSIAPKLLQS